VSQNGMSVPVVSHPGWCSPDECAVESQWPYGHHQSRAHLVRTDPACDTVVHLCLSSTPPGLKPEMVLLMELSHVDADLDCGAVPGPGARLAFQDVVPASREGSWCSH
jgi:hypothetical protein